MQTSSALRAVEDPIPTPHEGEAPQVSPAWGPARRFLFRFACVYMLLYSFPFPLYYIPYVGELLGWYSTAEQAVVTWTGKQVFGVDITVQPNGSGDTTYNYVQVFCFLVLATAAALVWSFLDRRRRSYPKLYEWLRVYVRFVVAAAMIGYGAYKVIPSQFPVPLPADRLMQPLGDFSPMGLLWAFMGASLAYNVFAGLGELVGGLLLTFRRTTLLGALVVIGVMSNVVMLNFAYDVPVKLYSSHLLLMAVFLAAHDLRRLANVLVLNRTAEPAVERPLFERKRLSQGALALRTVFVLYITGTALYTSYDARKTYGVAGPKAPLQGVWNVEEFETDGRVLPPLVTDETRWRRVSFSFGRAGIQLMSDARQRYGVDIDPLKRTIALTKREDPKWKSTLTFRKVQPDVLALEGMFDGRKVRARLRLTEPPEFLLATRGFHWINEYPFHR